LFFAAFCLLGIGGLVSWFAFLVVPEWRVNHQFVEHTCTVLDKRLGDTKEKETEKENGKERENEKDETVRQQRILYRPEIKIEYVIGDETYVAWTYDLAVALNAASSYSSDKEGTQEVLDGFVVDHQDPRKYPCWYDSADPRVVVLARGYRWWIWLVPVVPASFLLIGGGGLLYAVLHWGKSAERRAAITRRAQQRDLFGANGRGRFQFPYVPDGADIVNSPGTTLRFRLPMATSPGWALFGFLLACVVWNGIVAVFVAIAVGGHLNGQPDWLLTLFILPFLAVGIAGIVFFVRRLLVTAGIGPTLVEISAHPLVPGGRYALFVSQGGRLRINRLDVTLVCEEQATYRQGTNTRTETRQVYQQEVFRREAFEVPRGARFQTECELSVPAGAMHSFKAAHNEIHWKLVVHGDVAGWPDYRRAFPLIVQPATARTGP
jgi:hypothetical protein